MHTHEFASRVRSSSVNALSRRCSPTNPPTKPTNNTAAGVGKTTKLLESRTAADTDDHEHRERPHQTITDGSELHYASIQLRGRSRDRNFSRRGDWVGIDDADSENPIAIVHPGPPFLVDPSLKQISYD